jgi:hypothetical protein
MWVDSIRFVNSRNSLSIEVKVVTASGVLSGAKIGLELQCSNGGVWDLSGTTNRRGLAKFKLVKAPAGDYWATLASLTYDGFRWDAADGVTTASHTLSRGNSRTRTIGARRFASSRFLR